MIEHKVILLILAVLVPQPPTIDGEVEMMTGFMMAQVPSLSECRQQQAIIENDFRLLRKKEATMNPEDIEPRIQLVQSHCMTMPLKLNLQETNNGN